MIKNKLLQQVNQRGAEDNIIPARAGIASSSTSNSPPQIGSALHAQFGEDLIMRRAWKSLGQGISQLDLVANMM